MFTKPALTIGIATLAISAVTPAHAQTDNYPNRPITIIVPFAPGGATDILARLMGRHMSTALGQSFVIENRAGAGGTIGARAVAKAEPNGYMLLMGTNASHAISVSTFATLGYDPLKDFQPIGLVAIVPQVLMVHPSVPVTNVKELIRLREAASGRAQLRLRRERPPPAISGSNSSRSWPVSTWCTYRFKAARRRLPPWRAAKCR